MKDVDNLAGGLALLVLLGRHCFSVRFGWNDRRRRNFKYSALCTSNCRSKTRLPPNALKGNKCKSRKVGCVCLHLMSRIIGGEDVYIRSSCRWPLFSYKEQDRKISDNYTIYCLWSTLPRYTVSQNTHSRESNFTDLPGYDYEYYSQIPSLASRRNYLTS